MKMKTKDHSSCLCVNVRSFILFGCLSGATLFHPIKIEIDDHTLKLHVLAVTKFSNTVRVEAEPTHTEKRKQLHQFSC